MSVGAISGLTQARPSSAAGWHYLVAARPAQLMKTIVAVGWAQYCAHGNRIVLGFEPAVLILAMLLLWAGLYGINDVADIHLDRSTRHKRFRPLASGLIGSRSLMAVGAIQIASALVMLFCLGWSLLILAGLQVVNQLLYSLEPFRLKRRVLWDVASAAVLSHGLRFAAGVWDSPARPVLGLACAALILYKTAVYLVYRLQDAPPLLASSGTAAALGPARTIMVSAIAIAGSYVCFGAYAIATGMRSAPVALISVLYLIPVLLFATVRIKRGFPRVMRLLVFSA